jgi:hypothetical protein
MPDVPDVAAIPAQRDPSHDALPPSPGKDPAPGGPALGGSAPGGPALAGPVPGGVVQAGSARARRGLRVVVAVVGALGVLGLGLVILRPHPAPEAAAAAATSAAPASPPSATPYDQAVAVLTAQADALVRGDEAGWLAAVDGKLQAKYRMIFRNLRGLGVTKFEYRPGLGKGDPSAMSMRVDALYCFGDDMCPAGAATEWAKPPHISQALTLKRAGGTFVISRLDESTDLDYHQPTPWESTDLVFARGARVVLAAAKGQEKYLTRVLPVAEQAAVVADHYAALNGTPQRDYRILLAADRQWKAWYGGGQDEWAIGVALPLNQRGIDVVIRMPEMDDALTLRTTLQHELGHVVTLTGAYQMDALEDTWLSEGIAEYIGWQPKHAAQSFRRSSVRWQFDRAAPKSMVPGRPGPKAPARAGDAFYGLSHWAADCMARQYGEARLFTFVRLVLTEDNTYDQAARDAYGVPFATVDKACTGWIRKQAAG